jgi:sulfatase-like protein
MTGSLQQVRPSELLGTEESTSHIQLSRHAVIAVSLANLSFMSAWQRRIYGQSFFSPLWSWPDLFALVLNVIALAALFCVLLTLGARIKLGGYRLDGLVYAIPLFRISNEIQRTLFPAYSRLYFAISSIAVSGIFCIAIFWYQRKLLAVVEFVALGLALIFPFNLWQIARIVEKSGAAPSLAARISIPTRAGPRVIWLVFDEMDFDLSFRRRSAEVRVPEFDRLHSEAFFATAAHQPGEDTIEALPTLISGRPASFSKPQGTRKLLMEFSPQASPVDWSTVPNVFSDARAAGINVGIVGWYFPYCRIFSAIISDCYWESMYSGVNDNPVLSTSVLDQLDSLTPVESRLRQIQRSRRMVAAAETMVNDPQLGLVLIHLPVPHGPPIFDRDSKRITSLNFRKDWFFDNLIFADQVMGTIRRAMEQSGQWDNSVVIVTSDHSLRQSMMPHSNPAPLVPFIVKMPGQTKGTSLDYPFNTDITRYLVGGISRGEITLANLSEWVRQHAQ